MICVTRRSAGLPFLLQALLGSAKFPQGQECLNYIVKSLFKLVESITLNGSDVAVPSDSTIHALNILRGLVKDASLGDEMLPYLSTCLKVAIVGFTSNNWQIRNASTLLFSSIIIRVFGVMKNFESSDKNRLSSYEFFTRMPELHQFFLQRLEEITKSDDLPKHTGLYPLLLVLSRLYPTATRTNSRLNKYIPLIVRCRQSPIYKCRVMAANALLSVLPQHEYRKVISQLFISLKKAVISRNSLHGTLIQLKALISSKNCSNTFPNICSQLICEEITEQIKSSKCMVVYASYIDLIIDVFLLNNPLSEDFQPRVKETLLCFIIDCLQYLKQTCTLTPGSTMFYTSFAKLLVYAQLSGIFTDGIKTCLQSNVLETKCTALKLLSELPQSTKVSWDELVAALVDMAIHQIDLSCLEKIFVLCFQRISQSNYEEILKVSIQCARSVSPLNRELYGAFIMCKAACAKHVIIANAQNIVLKQGYLSECLDQMYEGILSNLDNSDFRYVVVNAFLHLQSVLEIYIPFITIKAWKLFLLLLVDEVADIRQLAASIVLTNKVATTQTSNYANQRCVEPLFMEKILEHLVSLYGEQYPQLCREVCSFLKDLQRIFVASPTKQGDSLVFDPSATNSYYEAHVTTEQANRVLRLLESL
nr:thyroid adenoma-associated protein homolog isoform X1 [Ciona intestinalis]|eukprot:XP_002120511.2 thyroid adenoma-associated protein homolog isoform X1 [Ciona intestinalis]